MENSKDRIVGTALATAFLSVASIGLFRLLALVSMLTVDAVSRNTQIHFADIAVQLSWAAVWAVGLIVVGALLGARRQFGSVARPVPMIAGGAVSIVSAAMSAAEIVPIFLETLQQVLMTDDPTSEASARAVANAYSMYRLEMIIICALYAVQAVAGIALIVWANRKMSKLSAGVSSAGTPSAGAALPGVESSPGEAPVSGETSEPDGGEAKPDGGSASSDADLETFADAIADKPSETGNPIFFTKTDAPARAKPAAETEEDKQPAGPLSAAGNPGNPAPDKPEKESDPDNLNE